MYGEYAQITPYLGFEADVARRAGRLIGKVRDAKALNPLLAGMTDQQVLWSQFSSADIDDLVATTLILRSGRRLSNPARRTYRIENAATMGRFFSSLVKSEFEAAVA